MRTLTLKYAKVSVNTPAVASLAKNFREVLARIPQDSFTDPKYYPPPGTENELVLRYFIFMVAIDHRTSRYGPFEGYVDNEFYHGADLLYRLGMKKFEEDPEFFDPHRMSRITTDEVKSWLSAESHDGKLVTIWDPEKRAFLLRDLGKRLMELYGGRVQKLLDSSRGRLKGPNSFGLIDKMKVFTAYSDPVEKKAYLYAKFISRRGLFTYSDPENAEVPVDNHLVRIALRLGIVSLEKRLWEKIIHRERFTWDEDITLRLAVKRAYKLLARITGVDPLVMDDFLWLFGRHCCTREKPTCAVGCVGKCRKLKLCYDECPFNSKCLNKARAEEIIEHNYLDTYYY